MDKLRDLVWRLNWEDWPGIRLSGRSFGRLSFRWGLHNKREVATYRLLIEWEKRPVPLNPNQIVQVSYYSESGEDARG